MWNPKEAARECVEDTGDISYDNFTTCIVEEVRCRGEDHITYPVTTIIPETTPTAEASTIPEDITEVEPTTVPSTSKYHNTNTIFFIAIISTIIALVVIATFIIMTI